MPSAPQMTNCMAEVWKPVRSTAHMEQMKPMVPKMRIGGKSRTVS